jgi:site-specific DNA recombinase
MKLLIMKENNLIKTFAKGGSKKSSLQSTRNAVIYTRVSTKEQADTNQSLEIQKKYCLQYALKNDLNVLGFFGGTYESAKTDERNEFNRMIKFVKNQKEGVSHILVYSLDRFSRTGDNAIFISSELKRQGISIMSVTQPIDVSTHSGILQQNIQFIFSKYDNDLRKEKCMAGMKEKLLRGEWIGYPPAGYSYDHVRGAKEQRIVINEKGRLIRQAFLLKAQQGLTNTEIAHKISTSDLKVTNKRLTKILRNPFYCGYISHELLDGELAKGKHKPLVSETIFLKANDMLKRVNYGYKQLDKNDNIPLKNFVRCADCQTPMTGYMVKKKRLYYYKCNRIGCRCNRSAKLMNQLFSEFLNAYQIDKRYNAPLKDQLLYTFTNLTASNKELVRGQKQTLSDVDKKLMKVEERFALGEIDRLVYDKIAGKFRDEKRRIEKELGGAKNKLSNQAVFIDKALEISSNLSNFWVSGDYDSKRKLQEILFPEGIWYDKEKGNYRTDRVNVILELIRSFSEKSGHKKSGSSKILFEKSASVPKVGIEPTLPKEHDLPAGRQVLSRT